jgi:hypothetical protein
MATLGRKKKGLPFVVQPKYSPVVERIGTEESGIIEVERRGYLTVQEKAIMQGAMEGDTTLTDLFMLCREIAQKEGLEAEQVFNDMTAASQPEYFEKYAQQISASMTKLGDYNQRQRMVAATALLMTRLDSEWDASDTVALHPDLIDALYQLFNEEDKKSTEALEEAAKGTKVKKEANSGK